MRAAAPISIWNHPVDMRRSRQRRDGSRWGQLQQTCCILGSRGGRADCQSGRAEPSIRGATALVCRRKSRSRPANEDKKEKNATLEAYLNATEWTVHMPIHNASSAEQLHAVALSAAVLCRLAAGADGVLAHQTLPGDEHS
jgi:hypothetical protein